MVKVLKLAVIVLFISSFLIACSASKTNKVYEEMLEKGFDQIEKNDLVQAKIYFEKALDTKPDDQQAALLLNQVVHFQNAEEEMKTGDIHKANEFVEKVLAIKEGSNILIEKAISLQKEIEKLFADEKQYKGQYEKAERVLEEQSFEEALASIQSVLNKDLRHDYFQDLKTEFETLKQQVMTAQKETLAREIAEAQKQAEQEAEKAEQEAIEEKQLKEEKVVKVIEKEKQEKNESDDAIRPIVGYWLLDTMACHITSTYVACALAESDFITNNQILAARSISETIIELSLDEATVQFELIDGDLLQFENGEVYQRVSKDEANAIYGGYYELP